MRSNFNVLTLSRANESQISPKNSNKKRLITDKSDEAKKEETKTNVEIKALFNSNATRKEKSGDNNNTLSSLENLCTSNTQLKGGHHNETRGPISINAETKEETFEIGSSENWEFGSGGSLPYRK